MMNNLSIRGGESEPAKPTEQAQTVRPQQQQAPQTRAPAVSDFEIYLIREKLLEPGLPFISSIKCLGYSSQHLPY